MWQWEAVGHYLKGDWDSASKYIFYNKLTGF